MKLQSLLSDLFNTTKCSVSYTLICWPEVEAGKAVTFLCPSLFFQPDSKSVFCKHILTNIE